MTKRHEAKYKIDRRMGQNVWGRPKSPVNRREYGPRRNMIGLLESRLDALIYRAKFVPTVFAARQFINHGHIKVNGKRVNISSFRLKAGDLVEVKDKSKQLALVLEATGLGERDVPDYIEVDHSKMTAKLARIPTITEVPYPVMMEPQLVVEFYSR